MNTPVKNAAGAQRRPQPRVVLSPVPPGARLAEMDEKSKSRVPWAPWWRVGLRWLGWAVGLACWLNLVALAVGWAAVFLLGDRWWLATVVLFSPRWFWLLPTVALLPAAALLRRRALVPVAGALLLAVFGPMGCSLPWARASVRDGTPLNLVTLNCQGGAARPSQLRALLTDVLADAVALQECGWPDKLLRQQVLPERWHLARAGGLVLASRHAIGETEVHRHKPPGGRWPRVDALYGVIERPQGRIGLCCVHVRTPRAGLQKVLSRTTVLDPGQSAAVERGIRLRRLESAALLEWLDRFDRPRVIAGDLNMPPDSAIYRQTWSRLDNAHTQAGFGFGYTKITPVVGIEFGLRIDHVLYDDHWGAAGAWVADDLGSDHLPLVAKLVQRDASRNQEKQNP